MIPITILNFQIETKHPLDFGAHAGSSLRGAIYEALHVMYDHDTPVTSRYDAEDNPVAWLLRLEDAHTSGGKNVPRPFGIRPPLVNYQNLSQFGITFYGKGQEYLPLILSAMNAIQQIGLGRGRQKFQIKTVSTVDPLSRQTSLILNDQQQVVGEIPPSPSAEAYQGMAKLLKSDQLHLQFLTPTRIVEQDVLQHQPNFCPWFKRLLERIRTISELYLPEPVWIPFKELVPLAQTIQTRADQTRWVESWSGSRRDGEMKPSSGFMGTVSYEGEFEILLPWILLGQSLQVGKNVVKGCGWYEVLYQWR